MPKSVLATTPDGTITLTITLPWKEVEKELDKVVTDVVKNATLPGFRKGMAPREMVEKSLDKTKVQDDVLRQLLPLAYSGAVKEHNLKPILSPKIKVTKMESPTTSSGPSDWEFKAETAEAPKVTLGKYKEAVKKITAKSKIVVPGKEEKKVNMDEIIKAILEEAKLTVPQILIDSETERLLSQLLDEIKSLGLSLDQYLTSTHKTIDQVKKEYQDRANQDITFEFVLQEIANQEKISVEQKELEEALEKAQSPQERQNLEKNIYLLASILRQQKTLDFLRNL